MAQSNETTPAWYKEQLGSRLTPLMKRLFQSYSGIAEDAIEKHVTDIRDRAWKRYKYPCIGQFQFLYSPTPDLPFYNEVLTRVKTGASLLDLGCCFGQDLRIMAAEGTPTEKMYASDIVPDFWDLGYELFCDRNSIQARFLPADIFDPASQLKELDGSMDIILATHFFHLFSYEQQVEAAKRMIKLCTPEAMIVGFHIGTTVAKETPAGSTKGSASTSSKYYHNEESFKNFWQQVEHETGTRWSVDVALCPLQDWHMPVEDFQWMGPNARGLRFAVVRKS